jgi:ABC-2 type transport system ATP-binding protein
MTPHEMLTYCGRVRGMGSTLYTQRYDYVIHACSLKTVIHKPISKLSKGFRQRLGMAQALLHDPPVLILDEPTSGLDPVQTAQARELIKTLSKDKTILLSTHILTEVQAVCQRVILINNGRLLFDGETKSLSHSVEELEQKFRDFVLKDNKQDRLVAVS